MGLLLASVGTLGPVTLKDSSVSTQRWGGVSRRLRGHAAIAVTWGPTFGLMLSCLHLEIPFFFEKEVLHLHFCTGSHK